MGFGDWLRRHFDGGKKREPGSGPKPARWLAADDEGNPFGVPLLDLMQNLSLVSTTSDASMAQRSVSWGPGCDHDLGFELEAPFLPCDLSYPAGREVPDGMLFFPSRMEEKWVLAYRKGRIVAARSWTGETKALARTKLADGVLTVTGIAFASDAGFDAWGDPIATFDWLIRTHALREKIPLPVSEEGGRLLEVLPIAGFSSFGSLLFCAAVDYVPGEPAGCIYSDGELVAAVGQGDEERVRAAISEGVPIDAPSTFNHGATALYLAIHLHPELVPLMVEAGADVTLTSAKGSTCLMAAAAAGAEPELVRQLAEWGTPLDAADALGFAATHVAAQFGNVAVLEALVALGADLSARTQMGLHPLHVAAGTGKAAVVEWLLAHGVDASCPSPLGDPLAIAEEEGQEEVVRILRDAHRAPYR